MSNFRELCKLREERRHASALQRLERLEKEIATGVDLLRRLQSDIDANQQREADLAERTWSDATEYVRLVQELRVARGALMSEQANARRTQRGLMYSRDGLLELVKKLDCRSAAISRAVERSRERLRVAERRALEDAGDYDG